MFASIIQLWNDNIVICEKNDFRMERNDTYLSNPTLRHMKWVTFACELQFEVWREREERRERDADNDANL